MDVTIRAGVLPHDDPDASLASHRGVLARLRRTVNGDIAIEGEGAVDLRAPRSS